MPAELVLKIAAGEVVERPASAVKELIDNALDAGADTVRVETREAGMKLIRVTDNGSGIARDDVPLAFTAHATSKIAGLDDLLHLSTLGFRGEALSSIAAVSRVEVQTRAASETVGTRMLVEYGEIGPIAPVAVAAGTRMSISDLFSNVPARRKFVRSLRAEGGHIASVVAQYALARPDVHLVLSSDGRVVFESPGTGRLADALAAVHGLGVADSTVPVSVERDDIRIEALVSRPQLTRPTRSSIHISVNGRPVISRTLPYVLEEAYSGYLMVGRHPLAAVRISLPPADVDPNIHPSKQDVRITRDREVSGLLYRAVAEALLSLRSEERGGIEVGDEMAGPGAPMPLSLDVEEAAPAPIPLVTDTPALRVFGQSNRTFIVAEGPEGLYMIDQHAAHERILFDRFDGEIDAGTVARQPLLEPVSVPLTPGQMQALDENRVLLAAMGLDVEPFGADACLVRAVPALASRTPPVELIAEVLTELETLPVAQSPRERALAAMACKAAVKAGQMLDLQEMREMVVQLERTPRPATCPHGRPTMIHLSHTQLEREFGRR
jgi:DNA mismatch repair protein MutL